MAASPHVPRPCQVARDDVNEAQAKKSRRQMLRNGRKQLMEPQTDNQRTRSVMYLLSFMAFLATSGHVSGDTEVGMIQIQDDLTATIRRSVGETDSPVALSPGHYSP